MSDETYRSVWIERTEQGRYTAHNVRGGELSLGSGESADFTPVELLLTAIAGCSAIDVDLIVSKRAEPTAMRVLASGDKVRSDTDGNHMEDLRLTFDVTFPDGEAGDRARDFLQRAIEMSRDRLCTVSRTVALPSPVEMGTGPVEGHGD